MSENSASFARDQHSVASPNQSQKPSNSTKHLNDVNMTDILFPYLIGYGMIGAWLPALALSIAPAIYRRSWKVFFLSLLRVVVGITLPVYWFLLSVELLPDWKGACTHGAFTCFVVGKLWLSPFVVWARAAYYTRVVWEAGTPHKTWITLGYWVGAIVSVTCLVHGLINFPRDLIPIWPFLVPILTAIYFSVVARRLVRESGLGFTKLLAATLSMVPSWALSVWHSQRVFDALPSEAPQDCFVVTAAMRGHASLVGPFHTIRRRGQERLINDQLQTFWEFETVWAASMPRLHRVARRIYNRVGPYVARRITRRWVADVVYLSLKPAEWTLRALKWKKESVHC
jgi:hypothetical protein